MAPDLPAHRHARAAVGSHAHLLGPDCWVAEGRLEVAWTYSPNIRDRATVEEFAAHCLARFNTIIDHCCSPRISASSLASDLPLAGLDQDMLDQFQQRPNAMCRQPPSGQSGPVLHSRTSSSPVVITVCPSGPNAIELKFSTGGTKSTISLPVRTFQA